MTRSEAILDSEPSPVQDDDDDPDLARQLFQDATDFVAAEHNRHPNRQAGPRHIVEPADFNAEHVLVQKQQRAERLILRGGTDVSLDCEPGQKRRDFSGAHLGRVRLSVKHDVTVNPVDVRFLRPAAVMPRPYGVPYPIEELRRRSMSWRASASQHRAAISHTRVATPVAKTVPSVMMSRPA